MSDLVFLDIETLGLEPIAPIWEFAAIRRFAEGGEFTVHFQIAHDHRGWLEDLPEQFRADYEARYDRDKAWAPTAAVGAIYMITENAHIVGAVPSFDTERLGRLMRGFGVEPKWHYHLIDVENVVLGYLAGQKESPPAPPWKSDDLSRMVGVNPADYERHTALGDCLWTMAQWDAVM